MYGRKNDIVCIFGNIFFCDCEDLSATRCHFLDISTSVVGKNWVRQEGQNRCSILNQGNGSVLELSSRKTFTLDVRNLFEFETSFTDSFCKDDFLS